MLDSSAQQDVSCAEDSNATTVTDAGIDTDLEDEAASHSGKQANDDSDPETQFLRVSCECIWSEDRIAEEVSNDFDIRAMNDLLLNPVSVFKR